MTVPAKETTAVPARDSRIEAPGPDAGRSRDDHAAEKDEGGSQGHDRPTRRGHAAAPGFLPGAGRLQSTRSYLWTRVYPSGDSGSDLNAISRFTSVRDLGVSHSTTVDKPRSLTSMTVTTHPETAPDQHQHTRAHCLSHRCHRTERSHQGPGGARKRSRRASRPSRSTRSGKRRPARAGARRAAPRQQRAPHRGCGSSTKSSAASDSHPDQLAALAHLGVDWARA